MVFVTDVGNPIALPKAAIVSVIGRSEDRGFGRVIDNTTFELGLAPNDAPDAEEGAPADQVQAFVDALQQSQGQPVNYNVQQFAEPSATGGLPVNWVAPPPAADRHRGLPGAQSRRPRRRSSRRRQPAGSSFTARPAMPAGRALTTSAAVTRLSGRVDEEPVRDRRGPATVTGD